ncbi:MAG: hypothetical protein ACRCXT_19655 [Paraclostridium sp.]
MTKKLIRKNYILEGGITKENSNPQTIIPFTNMVIETNQTDPAKVILVAKDSLPTPGPGGDATFKNGVKVNTITFDQSTGDQTKNILSASSVNTVATTAATTTLNSFKLGQYNPDQAAINARLNANDEKYKDINIFRFNNPNDLPTPTISADGKTYTVNIKTNLTDSPIPGTFAYVGMANANKQREVSIPFKPYEPVTSYVQWNSGDLTPYQITTTAQYTKPGDNVNLQLQFVSTVPNFFTGSDQRP